MPTPDAPATATVASRDVIDLTAKMKPDGSLDWDAPAGTWTILRLGYSLTGAKNRPATPAGSGYEADKLSRKHMEAYYHGYFDPIAAALGPLFGKSLRYVMMDIGKLAPTTGTRSNQNSQGSEERRRNTWKARRRRESVNRRRFPGGRSVGVLVRLALVWARAAEVNKPTAVTFSVPLWPAVC